MQTTSPLDGLAVVDVARVVDVVVTRLVDVVGGRVVGGSVVGVRVVGGRVVGSTVVVGTLVDEPESDEPVDEVVALPPPPAGFVEGDWVAPVVADVPVARPLVVVPPETSAVAVVPGVLESATPPAPASSPEPRSNSTTSAMTTASTITPPSDAYARCKARRRFLLALKRSMSSRVSFSLAGGWTINECSSLLAVLSCRAHGSDATKARASAADDAYHTPSRGSSLSTRHPRRMITGRPTLAARPISESVP
jgi:hypothetical protein